MWGFDSLIAHQRYMKIEVQSKKGLRTNLSIVVDKKTIEKKLKERLLELQSEVNIKGFRPGKVPTTVIKGQFGKALYGEVIDKILKESSMKALEEKKIKAAGQPKINLKVFGEGKDLNYVLEVDSLPEINLKPLENFTSTDYQVKVEEKTVDKKLQEIAEQHKNFADKKDGEKAVKGDQITFDYSATIDDKKFDGSEGKNVKIELGKDLFLKGFDQQLIGVKIKETKFVEVNLPSNHPKKELANKKTKFECRILEIKHPKKNLINDNFAKQMGAKDLKDLKGLIEKQITSQYKQALDSITKKEIFDQIEKAHNFELPKNLIDNEIAIMTQNLNKEEKDKNVINNEKLAKSRIKVGLILNEYGEKNNLKVNEEEVKLEIQKQIKSMPGQEKMVFEHYQKNPNASQNLKGMIYEDKIIKLIKSKIKLNTKAISITEAEKIISNFQKPTTLEKKDKKELKSTSKNKAKLKKISKK